MKRLKYISITLLLICLQTASAQFRIQQLDDQIMIGIQQTRTPGQTEFFRFMSNTYKYGDIGVPAVLLAAGTLDHNQQMRQNSLFVASSTALSYGMDYLIKRIVKRRRPFDHNSNLIPVYRAASTSFPSGHAATTFSTATALSMAYPKWYVIAPSFVWAGTVSYSRMYLGVHYPTDVAAGAVLGAGSSFSLLFLKK